jgi:hypothetical protein
MFRVDIFYLLFFHVVLLTFLWFDFMQISHSYIGRIYHNCLTMYQLEFKIHDMFFPMRTRYVQMVYKSFEQF